MTAGDLVWFLQTCRGGYGFQQRVPAVFLHATARRAVIEVHTRDGQRKRIGVHPRNVVPRRRDDRVEDPTP